MIVIDEDTHTFLVCTVIRFRAQVISQVSTKSGHFRSCVLTLYTFKTASYPIFATQVPNANPLHLNPSLHLIKTQPLIKTQLPSHLHHPQNLFLLIPDRIPTPRIETLPPTSRRITSMDHDIPRTHIHLLRMPQGNTLNLRIRLHQPCHTYAPSIQHPRRAFDPHTPQIRLFFNPLPWSFDLEKTTLFQHERVCSVIPSFISLVENGGNTGSQIAQNMREDFGIDVDVKSPVRDFLYIPTTGEEGAEVERLASEGWEGGGEAAGADLEGYGAVIVVIGGGVVDGIVMGVGGGGCVAVFWG